MLLSLDRPGKQPDGSSKTREVKLVTIWSAEGRDKEGTPVRDAGSGEVVLERREPVLATAPTEKGPGSCC